MQILFRKAHDCICKYTWTSDFMKNNYIDYTSFYNRRHANVTDILMSDLTDCKIKKNTLSYKIVKAD
jgi:hypothetical protein